MILKMLKMYSFENMFEILNMS